MDFTSITQYDLSLIPILGGPHSVFFDAFSLVLTNGWTWIALYLALLFVVIKNNETMAQISLVILAAAVCVFLSDIVPDGIVKPMAMRLRPLNDPQVRPLLHIVSGAYDRNYSFFSAHAANTFAVCVFFSMLIRNIWLTIALVAWSLTNCWTRIYLGMHYPSDIAVGLLWGFIVGMAVYFGYRHFYHKITPRLHFISSQYTRTGYALSDVTLITNVLLLTVLYAIIRSLITVY